MGSGRRKNELQKTNLQAASVTIQGRQPVAIAHANHWTGPIPPPEALEKFESIQKGFADRILTMAEKNNDALIRNNAEALRAAVSKDTRAQYLAFAVAALGFIAACYCGVINQPKLGGVIASVTIGGLAVSFITGRSQAKQTPQDTK